MCRNGTKYWLQKLLVLAAISIMPFHRAVGATLVPSTASSDPWLADVLQGFHLIAAMADAVRQAQFAAAVADAVR
jgi:hypothetical protein